MRILLNVVSGITQKWRATEMIGGSTLEIYLQTSEPRLATLFFFLPAFQGSSGLFYVKCRLLNIAKFVPMTKLLSNLQLDYFLQPPTKNVQALQI